MKTIGCKIAAFSLLLAMLLMLLPSCARESDEEFLSTVTEMLATSAAVNEICFSKGLVYDEEEEGTYKTSGYVEATQASREKYGVSSVADIKAMMTSVYSVATCDYIDTVIFNPVREGTSFASYRRYFDAMDGDGGTALMVKKDYEPLALGSVSYSEIRISSHSRARAEILVNITVADGENSRTDRDVSLPLRFEDGAWKFDSVTYSSLK